MRRRKKAEEVGKVKKSLTEAQAKVDAAKKELADAQSQAATATKQLSDRIRSLEDQNKRDLEADSRTSAARSRWRRRTPAAHSWRAGAKREETALLRAQKSAVEKQANEFKLRQAELTDKIRELERIQETANRNNTDLRERVAKFTTLLQKNGLSTDISQIKGRGEPAAASRG